MNSPHLGPAVLTAVGLRFSRAGTTILSGIDLHLLGGQRTALTGPSGSGKTVLMSLLAGLALPDSGTILLDGQPLTAHGSALRRRIGVVFQGYALVSLLTAAENIELGLAAVGRPPDEAADLARRALEQVGLADRAEHLIEELSGGQQQRVAIARAIASQPEILLADEPTAEQDAAHRAQALQAILAVAATGAAVLLATHDPDVAALCDREVRLHGGTLTPV